MPPLLHHLLPDSAQRTPEAEAVAFEGQRLTYAQLEGLSNQMAHALIEQGVRPGDRVAIFSPKCPGSLIAMHGILKAGGVYVPLDPNSPPQRVGFILSNCGVRCVAAAGSRANVIGQIAEQGTQPEVVVRIEAADGRDLEGLGIRSVAWADVITRTGSAPPAVARSEHDLAYILYTSGSTGVPKGVMISHLNALAFVDWAASEFSVVADDRLSSHAPLHFDLSIFDVFAAMKAGAAVVLVPDGTSTFPMRLAQWIEANRITVWYSVPSILTLLLLKGRLDQRDLRNLRLVLFAGEVFPVKYLRGVMRALPHAGFANLYGPTETNVITCYRLPAPPAEDAAPIPIGRPCSGAEITVVDDTGAPVDAAAVPGELHARGPTVAQGYWGDPERSARGFADGERRLYRTGDIVTRDGDGNYRLIGRRDRMIKRRG